MGELYLLVTVWPNVIRKCWIIVQENRQESFVVARTVMWKTSRAAPTRAPSGGRRLDATASSPTCTVCSWHGQSTWPPGRQHKQLRRPAKATWPDDVALADVCGPVTSRRRTPMTRVARGSTTVGKDQTTWAYRSQVSSRRHCHTT